MRQINIFFKISNVRHRWFTRFVRSVNMKLFCKRANQNKNNFMFTTLTKLVNNQTNCCITYFGKNEENMYLSRIYLAAPSSWPEWRNINLKSNSRENSNTFFLVSLIKIYLLYLSGLFWSLSRFLSFQSSDNMTGNLLSLSK